MIEPPYGHLPHPLDLARPLRRLRDPRRQRASCIALRNSAVSARCLLGARSLSRARTIARSMASVIARLAVATRFANHRPHAVSRRAVLAVATRSEQRL